MSVNLTARGVLRAHARGPGGVSAGPRRYLPDVAFVGGPAALAALAASPVPPAFDASRLFIFDGACDRAPAAQAASLARDLAVKFACRILAASEGCPLAVAGERGFVSAGSLAVTAGLGAGAPAGDGALYWPLAPTSLTTFLAEGVFAQEEVDVHRVVCRGTLRPGVGGADVGLYLSSQFGPGGGEGMVLEFGGSAVEAMAEDERNALAAAVTLCGPRAVFRGGGAEGDADAYYEYDFTALAPQVASSKDAWSVRDVNEVAGMPVRQVVIGPAGRHELAAAARLLAGARIHSDVILWVMPTTRRVHFGATVSGDLAALIEAGANVLPFCSLPWANEVAAARGAVAVTHPCTFAACAALALETFYTSAPTAAATALAGELCNPGPLLSK